MFGWSGTVLNLARASVTVGYTRSGPNAVRSRAARSSGVTSATGASMIMMPPMLSGNFAAAMIDAQPPMLCPMMIGVPVRPASRATLTISVAQLVRLYSSRRPLSPWPDISIAITRYSLSISGAMWSHQPACPPPPCTRTIPGRSRSPQHR